LGLEFQTKELREQVQIELFHRGVLVAATMNANRTVRIEPPLIITESQINFMVDTLESILVDIDEGDIRIPEPPKADLRKMKAAKKEKKSAKKNKKRSR